MFQLRAWLTAPTFDDDEKTRQAFLLHVILWTLLIVAITYVLVTLVSNPSNPIRNLIQSLIGGGLALVLMVLLRQGHVRPAAMVQVMSLWSFFTVSAFTGAGVRGEPYLVGYGLVIINAGIYFGNRGVLIITFLSIFTGGVMVVAESNSLFPLSLPQSPFETWVISVIVFPIIATLQALATRTIQQALSRARLSETSFRLLIAESPLGILIIDEKPGIVAANPAACLILGYHERELLTQDPLSLIDPDNLAQQPLDVDLLVAGETLQQERLLQRQDGSRVLVIGGLRAMPDGRFQYIFQDITARKQVEFERESLIRQLEDTNAELERFAYTVSHDLKTPLITIRAFLGYLQKDVQAGDLERFAEDWQHIDEASKRMRKLLDDLLELSRIGRLMNPVNLLPFADIVQDAIILVEGRLRAEGITLEIAQDLPMVQGDRLRLVEVMQNLVENAIKFRGQQSQPHIQIGVHTEQGEHLFYVRDNGMGIDPQYQEQIFRLFEKLDGDSDGTGIGLALVSRIVAEHNGRVWVESGGEGRGATFFFSLPEVGQIKSS